MDKSRRPLRLICRICLLLCLSAGFTLPLVAQPGASTADLPKPKKFENRVLASEKSTSTKMNFAKRWSQNINTRFNFDYNAGVKLDNVIQNAKQSFKEDYSKLLPFYNYSLDVTSQQEKELDSVIHKCNNGILLHDLRNDWIDDLYLLMGQAYFFRKDFDSAGITFQYINYAFQPRNKDEVGYDKFIGSNVNTTGNVYTISTPESKSGLVRAVTHTPARNASLVWLLRTLIETGQSGEASGLIQTLRRDPSFPSYLVPSLDEMQALWFYRQRQWDSAATYLEKALPAAETAQERARWEYLAAQLYERTSQPEAAGRMLDKAMQHTTDPILEAYARIAQIRLATGDDEAERIRQNIEALEKMAKKARYEEYRHIIYYAAAKLELSRADSATAIVNYGKSLAFNSSDPDFKNNTFLDLADLAFDMRKYPVSANYYDSADLNKVDSSDARVINDRKALLRIIVPEMDNIHVEDSLLQVAAMPETERNAYLKSLSKRLRKERGLKEEESLAGGGQGVQNRAIQEAEAVNIFAANDAKNGEWYFYNSSLKSQGKRLFEAKWGDRPNQDNWRRMSAITAQANAVAARNATDPEAPAPTVSNTKTAPTDISVKGLEANLPLTDEAKKVSLDTIEHSLYTLGHTFYEKMGDCTTSIDYFEQLLNRFPNTRYQEEALFVLTRCYAAAGNASKANFYKGFLSRNHSQGKYLRYLNNPAKLKEDSEARTKAATATYDQVYNAFIEGRFEEALARKRKADSSFGEQYWSPQLLYIESVYYIKQRQDSLASATLNKIIALYPQSNMNDKVATLLNVLSRRAEIESYLTNLNVTRKPEDSVAKVAEPLTKVEPIVKAGPPANTEPPAAVVSEKPRNAETVAPRQPTKAEPTVQPKTIRPTVADSSALKAPAAKPVEKKGYRFDPKSSYLVLLVLDKVDPVYVSEARNALNRYNREKFYQQNLETSPLALTEEIRLVQVGSFTDVTVAMDYVEKANEASAREIFPWLPQGKYSYLLISPDNLELLKEEKNIQAYRSFLQQALPGKF